MRTGDTPASVRARQDRRLPTALVTTPESLSLLLSRADWRERFAHVHGGRRRRMARAAGVEARRAGRARARAPARLASGTARVGTVGHARQSRRGARLPAGRRHARARASSAGSTAKTIVIETAHPATIERFPWAGHIGTASCCRRSSRRSRTRARRWCSPTCARRRRSGTRRCSRRGPTGPGTIALHHGSLERDVREWVEDGDPRAQAARRGVHVEPRPRRRLRAGRPGAADRQSRRASRACCSAPGAAATGPARCRRSPCVPTQALELVEAAAAREAAAERAIEPRTPDRAARSTCWCSTSSPARSAAASCPTSCRREIRGTHAYRDLTDCQWQWALDFVVHGGASLNAYPEYRRVVIGDDGIARVPDRRIAQRHRTVDRHDRRRREHHRADAQRPAARHTSRNRSSRACAPATASCSPASVLEFIRVREMTAWVKPGSRRSRRVIPRWMGAKMPLSTLLAERTRKLIGDAARRRRTRRRSSRSCGRCSSCSGAGRRCRDASEWLIERITTARRPLPVLLSVRGPARAPRARDAVLATASRRCAPRTFSLTINDYGFGLLSPRAGRPDARRHRQAARGAERRARHPRRTQRRRARPPAVPRDRARRGPRVPGLSRPGRNRTASCRRRADCSTTCSPNTTRRTCCSRRRCARCWSASSRRRASTPRSRGCAAAARCCATRTRPTPFAFPLMVEIFRE